MLRQHRGRRLGSLTPGTMTPHAPVWPLNVPLLQEGELLASVPQATLPAPPGPEMASWDGLGSRDLGPPRLRTSWASCDSPTASSVGGQCRLLGGSISRLQWVRVPTMEHWTEQPVGLHLLREGSLTVVIGWAEYCAVVVRIVRMVGCGKERDMAAFVTVDRASRAFRCRA
jgi:hypothetical protein